MEKACFPSARHRKGLDLTGTLADKSRRHPSSRGADIPRVSHGIYGAIAQLGERLLCKQEVVGSIPSGSTNFPRHIRTLSSRPVGINAFGNAFVRPNPV